MKPAQVLLVLAICSATLHAEILFQEDFEDTDFSSRGWYDAPSADLSTDEHIPGSVSCFECFFAEGELGCSGGTPGRMEFAESESVLLSYWVKYSDNYVGSQRSYHPHEFHFVTNKDDRWVGPAHTNLTTYTEQVGGVVRIALQDSRNNDPDCILLNNDSFVGCDGDFGSYQFTEARSVCACNGLVGDLDGRDCFNRGDDTYYSARFWDSAEKMFKDEPGQYYKNDWHFIECYFQMNTVSGGVGVPDGVIQYWYDGELTIDHDQILFRTGVNADMQFDQFLIAPYIGDGSPVNQYMWVDDLTVGTTRSDTRRSISSGGRTDSEARLGMTPNGDIRIELMRAGAFHVQIANVLGRNLVRRDVECGDAGETVTVPAPKGNGLYLIVLRREGRLVARSFYSPG